MLFSFCMTFFLSIFCATKIPAISLKLRGKKKHTQFDLILQWIYISGNSHCDLYSYSSRYESSSIDYSFFLLFFLPFFLYRQENRINFTPKLLYSFISGYRAAKETKTINRFLHHVTEAKSIKHNTIAIQNIQWTFAYDSEKNMLK